MLQQPYVSSNQDGPFQLFGNMQGQSSDEQMQQNGFNVNMGNLSMGGVNLNNP